MNPILALIIANIIWGMASPIFKFALTNIPPFTLAFIRFFVASLFFLPFIKWKEIEQLKKRDWLEIIIGPVLFGIVVNITFFFLGLEKTNSINAPIIASSGPIFLFLLSVVYLKEKPKKNVLLGMIIAFIGALLIILAPLILDGKTGGNIDQFEGNLFFAIATAGSVLSVVIMKRVLLRVNVFLLTFLSFLISGAAFLFLALMEWRYWHWYMLDTAGVIGIVFGVLFSSAIAYFLHTYGLSKIKAQEVGVFTYIDPVVAIVIAIPLLGEYPNTEFIIGAFLVFLGILIAENRIHYHPFHRITKRLK